MSIPAPSMHRLALPAAALSLLFQVLQPAWASAAGLHHRHHRVHQQFHRHSHRSMGRQPAYRPGPAARALLRAINRDRARHGVRPLVLDPQESRCSRMHSIHMARLGYISHDQFPADICVSHVWMGENVGDARDAPQLSVIELHQMFMQEGPCPHNKCATPEQLEAHGHYMNLLDPQYHRIGIGVYEAHGLTWLTEDFAG